MLSSNKPGAAARNPQRFKGGRCEGLQPQQPVSNFNAKGTAGELVFSPKRLGDLDYRLLFQLICGRGKWAERGEK